MAPLEVLEHFGQLPRGRLGLEPKHSFDNMIRPCLIGRIEIPGLSRRLKRSDDYSGGIWAKVQRLAIQKLGLNQCGHPIFCTMTSRC